MSVPKPPSSLDNSCSVIHGNTLYSYSPQGFLSLPLQDGAQWKKLAQGVSVTGATCVGSTPLGNDANAGFFVVGGKSDSATYTGLQKYTYATGNWTTITPTVLVTQNRQGHGSTYIPANDVILVYAGSQNDQGGPSSQTFTIGASPPFEANSFQSNTAAPAVSPYVTNWSDSDAAMMTGDGSNGDIYWFNPKAGWRYSGASLREPLNKVAGTAGAVLISGTDGSKSLYTFDLSKSPNAVARVVVQDASGRPLAQAPPVTARDLEHRSAAEKRALTLGDWPSYNSTLAPKTTRQNFAVAQAPDGTVVFSGGNAQSPLSIFNVNKNSWVDAAALLGDQQQTIQDISSSTTTKASSTTTSTSTTSALSTSTSISASATATDATTPSDLSVPPIPTGSSSNDSDSGSGPSSNAILGITLGSIAGFLALLGLILFLLRQRKRRQTHNEAGSMGDIPGDEKDTTAFAKATLPPPSPSYFRGHQHQMSQESASSVAILMGRVGQHKPRMPSNDSTRDSIDSTQRQQFKSTISKPIPQPQHAPILQVQDDRGVAFAPNVAEPRPRNGPMEADDGTRRSSGWNRYWSGGSALQILGYGAAKRNTMASEQSSRYSQTTSHSPNPRATQDSATVPPLNFEGRAGISRVNSGSPVVSTYPTNIPWRDGMSGKIERPVSGASSGYSSGIPESIHDQWDPNGGGQGWGAARAPSSAYAPSVSSGKPQPLGLSKQPQLAMASTSNDMSWLNLGDNSRV